MKNYIGIIAFAMAIVVAGCKSQQAVQSSSFKLIRVCEEIPAVPPDSYAEVEEADISCPAADWAQLFRDLARFPNLKKVTFLRIASPVVPEEICLLASLENLHWNGCEDVGSLNGLDGMGRLHGISVTGLPTALDRLLQKAASMPDLKYFSIVSAGLEEIPSGLSSLAQIETLDLTSNNLHSLSLTFAGLKGLRYLLLGDNKFTRLPQVLKTMPSLEALIVDGNAIQWSEEDLEWRSNLRK